MLTSVERHAIQKEVSAAHKQERDPWAYAYRTDVPKLLDEVEERERNFIALEKSYEHLREALRQIAESEDPWYVGTVRHQEIARKALEWRGETA